MENFTDVNGVLWKIQPVGTAFTAEPDPAGKNTYINGGDALVDIPLGKAHLNWATSGEPVVLGESAQVKATEAVNTFAKANKSALAARVTASTEQPTPTAPPPQTPRESSLVALLAIVALIYWADK